MKWAGVVHETSRADDGLQVQPEQETSKDSTIISEVFLIFFLVF